ncbi:MAG TPA: hypothetical protein VFA07_01310 [Chthonomonadaceae bacterium]|nr:hypothetical protein [Chthonomonadaceae bacterium]
MSETDPAASPEPGSDLLAELARQKERIARLESLLAEVDRRVETPKTIPSAAARPKSTDSGPQTPVRVSDLGPQLQGFAEALMAYTAPKTADPPPKTRHAIEPGGHLSHESRQPAYAPQARKRRGPGRGGLLALLMSGALLIVVFAGAGVLYSRFLGSDSDNGATATARHYRPVPPDPVEPPEVLPEESSHTPANRPPAIAILPEALQGSHALASSPVPAAKPPARPETPAAVLRPRRHPHFRHKLAVPAPPKARPPLVEARRLAPHPAHYRIVETASRLPAPVPVHRAAPRMERRPTPAASRRLQLALAGVSVEHKRVDAPPAPKKPPMRAYRHPHRNTASLIPPHAHPGYDEKADAWMDRLP